MTTNPVRKTIFAAITAAQGKRPAAIELGRRSYHGGPYELDSRVWELSEDLADDPDYDLDFVKSEAAAYLSMGAEVDVYVYEYTRDAYGGVTELDTNMTAKRVDGGWVVVD